MESVSALLSRILDGVDKKLMCIWEFVLLCVVCCSRAFEIVGGFLEAKGTLMAASRCESQS
eukprot:scaffold2739_cov257-Pinguiococcus_pyrenoidosus.AAC.33